MNLKTFANPVPFSRLPLMMNSFDRVNKYPVIVPERLYLKSIEDNFELRSVVCVKETELSVSPRSNKQNIITGCYGLITTHINPMTNTVDSKHFIYDPVAAAIPVEDPRAANSFINTKPISYIDSYFSPEIDGYRDPTFIERAETTGTIFIYAKPTGANSSNFENNGLSNTLFYM